MIYASGVSIRAGRGVGSGEFEGVCEYNGRGIECCGDVVASEMYSGAKRCKACGGGASLVSVSEGPRRLVCRRDRRRAWGGVAIARSTTQVGEDLVDDCALGDCRDDLCAATALFAMQDVNGEGLLQELGPAQRWLGCNERVVERRLGGV